MQEIQEQDQDHNGYEFLTASEMAQFVLSDPYPRSTNTQFDVVWDDTMQDDTALGTFEIWSTDFTPPPNVIKRSERVTKAEWQSWFEKEVEIDVIKKRIFSGVFLSDKGLDDKIRKTGWKYLLGLYEWNESLENQSGKNSKRQSQYLTYKRQWKEKLKIADANDAIHENLFRIEKDVVRTDTAIYQSKIEKSISETIASNEQLLKLQNILMTYTTTFPSGEPGFVQGMADLASVFLITMENESDAFWTFAQFMNQKKSNFYVDGSGIKQQLDLLRNLIQVMDPALYSKLKSIDALHLFCAFRWILVLFRREFEFQDLQILWDVLFTDLYTTDFQVFISFAIFERYRNVIIEQINDNDELLRVFFFD